MLTSCALETSSMMRGMNIAPEVRAKIEAALVTAGVELRTLVTQEPDETRRLKLERLADGVQIVLTSFRDLPAPSPQPSP